MEYEPDIVARLRTEHERFARVPQENFVLGPLVHGRLSSLFTESANEIEQLRKDRDGARREVCELKNLDCMEWGCHNCYHEKNHNA